jgi:major vault protein
VRDTRTGLVRSVVGESYMLKAHEELWEMQLSTQEEALIAYSQNLDANKRIKHKLVSYRCPFNSAVQVYDYKKKTSRIVFGPALVTLEPDEQFTVTVLSGSKPKQPGMIKTLNIMLGPDFSTDIVQVETSDHAVLRLQLSYNWFFKVNKDDPKDSQKIFQIKDFVGDLCNLMASKVRSAVASADFDTFHKTSARLIRKAIFGVNSDGKINDQFVMPQNGLIITNVDIQKVEPVDAKTKESL